MSSKKQPSLKHFSWSAYFEAQKAMAAFTFVITPEKSFWEIKGNPATKEQMEAIAPALVFSNPKGKGKDGRSNFY